MLGGQTAGNQEHWVRTAIPPCRHLHVRWHPNERADLVNDRGLVRLGCKINHGISGTRHRASVLGRLPWKCSQQLLPSFESRFVSA